MTGHHGGLTVRLDIGQEALEVELVIQVQLQIKFEVITCVIDVLNFNIDRLGLVLNSIDRFGLGVDLKEVLADLDQGEVWLRESGWVR